MKSSEKILLVIVQLKSDRGTWTFEDLAAEMEELVNACHGVVVDKMMCRIDQVSAGLFLGEGKAKEIAEICQAKEIDTVILSHDLKGGQQRNLEEVVGRKTIDRTQLILDIFARRAKSQEGKMQVELAQLEYLLPRLVGQGVELSRLGGGIGTMGPGETKLEMDRRRIRERIDRLHRDLKDVSADRSLRRKKRQDDGIPLVSLVGYTNAGKSTLLNTLTQAGQVTHDGLFTTLDSLSRQLILPNHQKTVLSDTVGFLHELPHHLIESFKATLEETSSADLLLHVLDVSHPKFRNLHDSVMSVLRELDAHEKPTITVLNKIDRITDKDVVREIMQSFKNPVAVSALSGENIPRLLAQIASELSTLIETIEVALPLDRMDLVNLAHNEGQVHAIAYDHDAARLSVSLPKKFAGLLQKFSLKE
ncbi:MAG: GTPase HflX [Candidatus Omnitrophica bacterium]|nr:GTPase HflX [Candidatus Omnitrophota bacterium]